MSSIGDLKQYNKFIVAFITILLTGLAAYVSQYGVSFTPEAIELIAILLTGLIVGSGGVYQIRNHYPSKPKKAKVQKLELE